MSVSYILSQVAVVLAYICLALTYKTKNRIILLFFNFGYLILSGISYLFLSAYIGMAMSGVAIVRNIIFLIQNKDKNSKYTIVDYIILFALILIIIVSCVFTYDGVLSLLSPISTILYTFSVWQRNISLYKILGIPVSVLCVFYNIFVGSTFGIVCEVLFLIWVIIENIIYFKKNKTKS